MKLSQLRYFQAVCTYKSITKATEVLHITQPSVSNAIKELENEFGVDLFHRANNRLHLTPNGEILLRHANDILKRVDAAEQEMHALSARKKP